MATMVANDRPFEPIGAAIGSADNKSSCDGAAGTLNATVPGGGAVNLGPLVPHAGDCEPCVGTGSRASLKGDHERSHDEPRRAMVPEPSQRDRQVRVPRAAYQPQGGQGGLLR